MNREYKVNLEWNMTDWHVHLQHQNVRQNLVNP